MMLPYWLNDTLAATPAFLLVYVVIGLPWALVVLPRADWWRRIEALTLGVFVGAALLTVWMFMLGSLGAAADQPLMMLGPIAAGLAALAVVGWIAWWLRLRRTKPDTTLRAPLQADERLLIILIALALIVAWVVIAFWPFTAYDTLWVYGSLARQYVSSGQIASSIGYYPQYLPLQYAFGQMAFGSVNDHAARAGLILLYAATIGAVYALSSRLINRRTGVYAAALWALYPHVGEWSRAGDLEIVLTGLFTLAAAYFVVAWTQPERRGWYAALAGLLLGIGLWTKPTMGAFVWGILLLCAFEWARVRFSLRSAWPRWRLAIIALLTALPLGALWYVRNAALGLDPIVLPSSFWVSIAARSGAELGWPLLGLLVYTAYAWFGPFRTRPSVRWLAPGLALIAAGVLPSILQPHPMALPEWLLLAAGLALTLTALVRHARAEWTPADRQEGSRIGWALLLAAPFFITWFMSYSYHYRLSFPVVPILALPTAWVLARWLPSALTRRAWRWAAGAIVVLSAVPGILAPVPDPSAGWQYLWDGSLPTDHDRYSSGNGALMAVVDGLNVWKDAHPGQPLRVVAPGITRLPFFFTGDAILTDGAPTRLSDLNEAAYFVYGVPETRGAYAAVPVTDNQVLGATGRPDIMRRAWERDDGNFRYEVYELALDNRLQAPFINAPLSGSVVFGDSVRLLGSDLGGLEFWPGRRLYAHLYWEPLQPLAEDLSVFIHLIAPDGRLVATWDGPVGQTALGYYATTVWETGEIISDERIFSLPEGVREAGQGYRIEVGLYNPLTNTRLPVTVDGAPAGDSVIIENRIQLLENEP